MTDPAGSPEAPGGGASRAQRTVRNVAWLGSSQVIRQGISILTTVVLARFLSPAEFGVFAMTLFVNELAQLLVDFGIGSALIQRKEVSQRLLASCFWINLAIAGTAAIVLVLAGPWIAAYFKQPALQLLMLASGAGLLIAALMVLPQALLSRRLAFKDVAMGSLIGSLAGAASAIAAAYGGLGVWSLALQPVIGSLVNTAYLFARSRWRPTFEFSAAETRGVMAFSTQLLVNNAIGHVTRNLPSLILGPAMGAAALGLLTLAQTIAWLPVAQFSQAVVRATLPVFAQLQDEKERVRAALYRASGLIALLAFPLIAGIGVLAPDLIVVVFGPQWAPAAPLVSALSVLSAVQCVVTLSGTALLAAGRAGTLVRLSLIGLPLSAACLWVTSGQAVLAAVLGLVAANITMYVLTLALALRAIDGRWRDYLAPLAMPALHASAMAAVLALAQMPISNLPPLLRLVGSSLAGAAIYLSLAWWLNRGAVADLLGLIGRGPKRVG